MGLPRSRHLSWTEMQRMLHSYLYNPFQMSLFHCQYRLYYFSPLCTMSVSRHTLCCVSDHSRGQTVYAGCGLRMFPPEQFLPSTRCLLLVFNDITHSSCWGQVRNWSCPIWSVHWRLSPWGHTECPIAGKWVSGCKLKGKLHDPVMLTMTLELCKECI